MQPPHMEGQEQGVPGGTEGSGQPRGAQTHPEVLLLCLVALVFPSRGIPIAANLLLVSSCSSGTVPG